MAGAKRRSYKKKRVQRRRKSGYTKRKSTKKTYRKRRATKPKAKRTYRKRATKSRSRTSKGPSIGEMAFVVANYHPAPEAASNAQIMQQAVAAVSQGGDNVMLPMNF